MYPYPLFQRSYQWSLCIVLLSLLFCWWTTALKSQSPETAFVDGVSLSPSLPGQLAPTQSYSLTWEYQLSFINGTINADWVMKQVNPDLTTSIAKTLDISDGCEIIGDVAITGTQAAFNGGYIDCDLPDFEQEVFTYTDIIQRCPCNFSQVTPPWVAAKFKVAEPNYTFLPIIYGGNNLTSTLVLTPTLRTVLPIAYLENGFEYRVSTDGGMEYTELKFSDQGSITNPHTATPSQWATTFTGYNPAWIINTLQMNNHHEFLNIQEFLEDLLLDMANASFLSWSSEDPSTLTSQLDYEMGPNPTKIYIGGHPDNPSRFYGSIEKLSVDPGCQGGNGPD